MDNQDMKCKEPEIDLFEMLRQLWTGRVYLLKIIALALIAGLIVAFSIPREYTCTVKMAPEGAKSSITGNMSDLAAMAGINIGMQDNEGLNLMLYPDVVQSMPMMTGLAAVTIKSRGEIPERQVYEYIDDEIRVPWWESVLTAPFKLIARIRYGKDEESAEIDPYHLIWGQYKIIKELKKRVGVSIDKKTGMITAGVTMQDPVVAAIVADSLVARLERFVIDYRTTKAKQDFNFAIRMYTEAKQKYYDVQRSYARYVDENKNIVLESVLIEQERLKNEQALAYNVYSTLAQQVETSRMKVQEQTPSVTIIEPARVPVNKSNTSKVVILIGFGFIGCLWGFFRIIYSKWDKIYVAQ